jgi:hypothetical protein
MNARFRLLMVLPALLALAACMSPSAPTSRSTGEDETDKNGDKDGQSFSPDLLPAPVILA